LTLGTTYVKVAVLRPDEGIVGETNSSVPQFSSLDGPYRTIDPAAVLTAVEVAIASVLPLAGNLERILLSGQMHGWTLTDERNAPHLPLVTWQDNRALLACKGIRHVDQLRNSQPAEIWQAVGNELRSGLPVAGIYATDLTAIDGRLRMHSLLSWVAAALTANPQFVQHITDAAASGMFDLNAGSWSDEITASVGGGRLLLPRVSWTPEVVGFHRASGAAVVTPVGDQQAALLGAGITEGVTAFNISTRARWAGSLANTQGIAARPVPISTERCSIPRRICRRGGRWRTAWRYCHAVGLTMRCGGGPRTRPPRPPGRGFRTRTQPFTARAVVAGQASPMRTVRRTLCKRSSLPSRSHTSRARWMWDSNQGTSFCFAAEWPSVSLLCVSQSARNSIARRRFRPTETWPFADSPSSRVECNGRRDYGGVDSQF
jgi:hypothetical protein